MESDQILLFFDSSDPLTFPQTIPGTNKKGQEVILDAFHVVCHQCKKHTGEVRGTVKELPRCLEFDVAGQCDQCQFVTHTKARIYPDLHVILRTADGWGEAPPETSRWERLWSWFPGI